MCFVTPVAIIGLPYNIDKSIYKNHLALHLILLCIFVELFIYCIIATRNPDDGHGSDRNVLVKNK
jgi:hypothetical protein